MGSAIRHLRLTLKLSQKGFAEKIDRTVDAGTVSRWERGTLAPHKWKVEKLIAMAEAAGLNVVKDALESPLENWRAGLAVAMPELANRVTLLEIAAINADLYANDSAEDHDAFEQLRAAAAAVEQRLIAHVQEGDEPFLYDDYQRSFIAGLAEKHGSQKPARRLRNGKRQTTR